MLCKATWTKEFKREAGPPNHHDAKVDSDQDGHRVEYYAMLNRHRPMLKAISETRVALQVSSFLNHEP